LKIIGILRLSMSIEFYISIITASALFVFLAIFIVSFVWRYNQRQKEFEIEKHNLMLRFQGEATRAKLELQEQTLQKISQEIHDNIGASLTLAKMQLSGIDTGNYSIRSSRALELLSRSIQDLRDISKAINGHYILEQGLEKALMRELVLVQEAAGIKTSFEFQMNRLDLSAQEELILYRAIQEAINNALKHAQSGSLLVRMMEDSEGYHIEIIDKGQGMDMEQVAKSVGFSSLHSRMEALGGQMIVRTQRGIGTEITFMVPHNRMRLEQNTLPS
jgi:two-component system, NarL family, sensor kinase